MPSAGGPAALHGFLYQLLVHLDDVAKYAVDPSDAAKTTLEFEPQGGGDAHLQLPGKRIVQQIKTRANAGTWSLREIVDGPVTDFVRATQHRKTATDEFRFVSDGRTGHHVEFAYFLNRLREPGSQLQSTRQRTYVGAGELSDSGLVAWVRTQVHVQLKTKDAPSEADLLYVLTRLHLDALVAESVLTENVLSLLQRCLPNPGDADAKLKEMIGSLMSSLSSGSVETTGREFLRQHGVEVERVERLANLVTSLSQINEAVASRVLGYRAGRDVRPAIAWGIDQPQLLVISGRSGTGKSWRLARLAQELATRGYPAVLQPIEQTIGLSLDSAAKYLWNDVLHTPTVVDVAALKQALPKPPAGDPWMVVLIDGPSDDAELVSTVTRLQRDPQLRIVLTMDQAQAKRAKALYPDLLRVEAVGDFSVEELETLLTQGNVEPKSIPADLFALLRLPLLANLFVSQATGGSNFLQAPESEFALLDALWTRADQIFDQAPSVLRALARFALTHPKDRDYLIDSAIPGTSSALLEGLQSLGWVTLQPNGAIAFAHSRLAGWALANALSAELVSGQLAETRLHQLLTEQRGSGRTRQSVLADLLWLLGRTAGDRAMAARLLVSQEAQLHARELYEELLPSLGEVGLAILLERLQLPLATEVSYRFEDTFRRVAARFRDRPNTPGLLRITQELLASEARFEINLGLAIAEASALASVLDEVWRIHLADAADLPSDHQGTRDYRAYQKSFEAMRACLLGNVDWLDARIERAKDPQELRSLAFQLQNLAHDRAPEIWERQKARLLVGANDAPRGVLGCIRRFRDASLIDFVVSALASSEALYAGHAFTVVASIAPDRAVALLDTLSSSELYLWRNAWVQTLHRVRPDETENWIRTHLNEWSSLSVFALIRGECSALLTQAVIAAFCDAVDVAENRDNPWLMSWEEALVGMPHLEAIRALGGTSTETKLLNIARRRVDPKRGWHDHLLEDSRSLLRAIGGPGIRQLVDYELSNHAGASAHFAHADAPLAASIGTAAQVAKNATTKMGNANDDNFSVIYGTIILAALGADKLLFDTIDTEQMEGLALDTLVIRRGAPAWDDELVKTLEHRLKHRPIERPQLDKLGMLVSLSRAPHLVPLLEAAIIDSDPDEKLFIRSALSVLEYDSPSEAFALWAARWLVPGEAGEYAVKLLAACGTDACTSFLLKAAQQLALQSRGVRLAALVVEVLPESQQADDLAVKLFLEDHHSTQVYQRAAQTGDAAVRSVLRRRAVEEDRIDPEVRYAAIKALASVAPEDAAEAALWALESPSLGARLAISVVVRYGSDDQCERLICRAASSDRATLWAALGREFRYRDEASADRILARFPAQSAPQLRRAFAELAGWQGARFESEVRTRAENELVPEAVDALERARACQAQLRATARLLTQLKSAQGSERLSVLHTTIRCGDPFLLDDRRDVQWIGAHVRAAPYMLIYARSELKRLQEKSKASPW